MKRILFIGLGSAGQRHLRNILELLGEDVEIYAIRHHKSEVVFNNNLQVVDGKILSDTYQIKECDSIEDALHHNIDMAIIANPNRFHLEYAQVLAENGIDIFIEKPVGVDINEALKLKKIVEQKNVICQIGYQQRYNPCIMRVKEIVKRGMLGKILFAEAYVGERISKMHRYEDYHQMIEARQDLGGGVVLCQCHEIDHIYSIFGMPQKIYSVGGNRGDLGIGVETIMDSFLVYDAFEVRLHQDFIQYPTKKYIEIIGEKGKLSVDIVDGSLKLYGYENETEQEERFDGFERNSMFRKEIYDFISAHNAHDMTACNLEQGIGNLKIIEGIKLSAKEKREVWL